MQRIVIILSILLLNTSPKYQINSPDAILGKWESVKNNLIVEIYKENNNYKAKVVWFRDTDDESRPMNVRHDEKNPDAALRARKILGMQVLNHLIYNAKENRWENGEIYDCTTGKTWNSSASLTNDGLLKVRGFWHFEFIGQSLLFKKV